MNYFEDELLKDIEYYISKGLVIVENDFEKYFEKLNQTYPIYGSKIDWSFVENSIEINATDKDYKSQFLNFMAETINNQSLKGECIVVGDSLIDKALKMDVATLNKVIPYVIEIPQHHYIIAGDFSWCMVFTMEQDMCFGFAKNRNDIS